MLLILSIIVYRIPGVNDVIIHTIADKRVATFSVIMRLALSEIFLNSS